VLEFVESYLYLTNLTLYLLKLKVMKSCGNGGSTLGAFLCGAIIGAAVALLLAPKSGEEMRGEIRDFVDDEMTKYMKNNRVDNER
jgi:hypothetical protein